jgi:hypothetical protein
MNAKIVIPISVIITIVIVVFSLTQIETVEKEAPSQIETVEKEAPSQIEETSKIDSMLQQIKEDKIKNDNSYYTWYPNEREWIQSGPFQIDRSEYILGEKIFINIDYLSKNVKGKMIFSKIINSTHSYEYSKIQFDGSEPQQNFYLGLNLNKFMGICAADMLVGDWELIFDGTPFESLKFKVKNQIVPGLQEQYEPVC